MARLIRIALIVAINVLICILAKDERYSDEYDDVDVKKLLENKELRTQYINCFMETGPCITPQMKFFTEKFSEAFQTRCKKCTERQKEIFAQGIEWIQKNEPETWQLILLKVIEKMKRKAAAQT
ncbi:PREDICTED: ejaculatory bulb-specific protein 3-like [Cyphomyrmex costatus]|uniref:Ejaculatory bulb-specific protein 3 n=1 Tax=Cyphomyrmex costatus TaxID=456900 RepID=A0A151ICW5_9HYME|nr:PREDICTED: ejaculatory bulb-specific protein 3-like [Cyphomyrmex costatus]KYM98238.1 Ejaculatory bulb-specific protein 3 [Cyphomyrmex costatus]